MPILDDILISYGKVINVTTFYIEDADNNSEIQNIKKIDQDEFCLKTPFILSSEELLYLIDSKRKNINNTYIYDSVYSFDINATVNEINANHLDHFTRYQNESCLKDITFNIIKSRITKYNSVMIFLKGQNIKRNTNIKSSLKTSKLKANMKSNKQTKKVKFKL
jgi:hypothetical protein